MKENIAKIILSPTYQEIVEIVDKHIAKK